MSDIIVID